MPLPLAAMFFDKSKRLEQSWLRVTKETFLPSDTEIGPLVSDKKIFKTFYIHCNLVITLIVRTRKSV